jgi:hypothetical protein
MDKEAEAAECPIENGRALRDRRISPAWSADARSNFLLDQLGMDGLAKLRTSRILPLPNCLQEHVGSVEPKMSLAADRPAAVSAVRHRFVDIPQMHVYRLDNTSD